MKKRPIFTSSMLVLGVLLMFNVPMLATDRPAPTLNHAVAFGAGRVPYSPGVQQWNLERRESARNGEGAREQSNGEGSSVPQSLVIDWLGIGRLFPGFTVSASRPDPSMAVGDTEVVQWVNTSYAIFNKATGAIIPGPQGNFTQGNFIWHTLLVGSACANHNDGISPAVKFDRDAHRWLMAQNVYTSPYWICVAISQTATFADNLWYAYQFPVPGNGFPDYPKWGVWSTGGQSDGYYQTLNNLGPGGGGFVGPQLCGYDRAKLLVGDFTAEQICFQQTVNESSVLPGDRDSPTPPPSCEDEFFIGSVDQVVKNQLSLYTVRILSWSGGAGTITRLITSVVPYDGSCAGIFGGACVPQPGVTNMLDSLGDRLMYRFAYWNDVPQAALPAPPSRPQCSTGW